MRIPSILMAGLLPAALLAQASKTTLPHTGEVLLERSWEDASGSNTLLASTVEHPAEHRTDLYVYQYLTGQGAPKLVWDIKDFGGALCDVVLHENSVQILDLDGDGLREVSFIYQHRCDGLDPYVTKLMLHSKGQKYAIRGKFAVEDNAQVEKSVDAAFGSAPGALRHFAEAEWAEFARESGITSSKSVYVRGNGWTVLACEDLMASGWVSFRLLDAKGAEMKLPANILDGVRAAEAVSEMPDPGKVLFASLSAGVVVVDAATQTPTTLMTFLGDTEAVSMLEWSPDKRKVAFVALNNAQYPMRTRIFVLSLQGDKLLRKDKYDAKVFHMAAADWAVNSVRFIDDHTIEFHTQTSEGEEGPLERIKVE